MLLFFFFFLSSSICEQKKEKRKLGQDSKTKLFSFLLPKIGVATTESSVCAYGIVAAERRMCVAKRCN